MLKPLEKHSTLLVLTSSMGPKPLMSVSFTFCCKISDGACRDSGVVATMADVPGVEAMMGQDSGVVVMMTEDCKTDDLTRGKSLSALTKLNR